MKHTKTFKSRKGEIPWYVVALVLAIIVLLVSLGAVYKIREAQKEADPTKNLCAVAGGECKTGTECTGGEEKSIATCPKDSSGNEQICCKPPQ